MEVEKPDEQRLVDLRSQGVPNPTGSQNYNPLKLAKTSIRRKITIQYSFRKEFAEDYLFLHEDGISSDSEYLPEEDQEIISEESSEAGTEEKNGQLSREEQKKSQKIETKQDQQQQQQSEQQQAQEGGQNQNEMNAQPLAMKNKPNTKIRGAHQQKKQRRVKRKVKFSEANIMQQESDEEQFYGAVEAELLQDEEDKNDWAQAQPDSFDNFFVGFPDLNQSQDIVNQDLFQSGTTILESFLYFATDEFLTRIAEQTNIYRNQYIETNYEGKPENIPKYLQNYIQREYTKFDVLRYICVLICMGNLKTPSVNACWSTNQYQEVGISKIWSRDQFKLFDCFFHLVNNQQAPPINQEPLFKIQWVIDHVSRKSCDVWKVNNSLVIDEHMEAFKGRSNLKVYNKDKPNKWGIKLYILADALYGFTLKVNVCVGKKYCQVLGISQPDKIIQRVVLELLQGYEDKGLIIAMDNFYTSAELFEKLTKLKFRAIGTCRADRLKLSDAQKRAIDANELDKNDSISFIDKKRKLHMLAWHDRKIVKILTNFVGDEVQDKLYEGQDIKLVQSIPAAIAVYNMYTHGVDRRNQLVEYFKPEKKNRKWWKAIFSGILQTAIVNSWKIFQLVNNKVLNQRQFRQQLVDEIMIFLKQNDTHHKAYRLKQPKSLEENEGLAFKEAFRHYIWKDTKQHKCLMSKLGACKESTLTTMYVCAGCPYGDCYQGIHVECFREHARRVFSQAKQIGFRPKAFSRSKRRGPQNTRKVDEL